MLREYTLTDGSPVPDSPATTQPVGAYVVLLAPTRKERPC